MDIADALQIVIDLAKQNVLEEKDVIEDDLTQQMLDQEEAINMIEDLAVNQYGNDNFKAEDSWFDHKKQVLVADLRLSGSRWIVGSTNEPSPLANTIFIEHEDAAEPTYISVEEANLLIAALNASIAQLGEI